MKTRSGCWLFIILAGPAAAASAAHAQDIAALRGTTPLPGAIWLHDLDWSQSAERLQPNRSTKNTPITIAGQVFARGLAGSGRSELLVHLEGMARRFVSVVGIDDCEKSNGSKRFEVWLDGKLAVGSRVLLRGEAELMSVDLSGARELELHVVHGGDESDWDRFAWAGAQIVLEASALRAGRRPAPYRTEPEPTAAIASSRRAELSINGPRVFGGGPGRPFLYRLPVSGQGPVRVTVRGLPSGLRVDGATGIVAGTLPVSDKDRRFPLDVTAVGPVGKTSRRLELRVSRDPAARSLTPPMGWNSWNAWGMAVDAPKVRAAADAMVGSGLAAHGYRYINIDDGWEGTRDACGELGSNEKFGDLKTLADYVHAQGLKVGIYSSPGPKTCGGMVGSYEHERQDAATFARWGIDFLKYDWCTYDDIKKDWSVAEQRKPYDVMNAALATVPRDIVYSLCSYGRGKVWTWGAQAGGNLWRTTSDIGDSWGSLEGIAFSQGDKQASGGPGHFNDPDMLIVGKLGWGPQLRPTKLSGNEQILHITQWAMLAAPLLIGCDMTQLDDFTLDLLTNDEVLAVDQDERVLPAARVDQRGRTEVWARPLVDGTRAVALYNRGHARTQVRIEFAALGVTGRQPVRDLWRREDLGVFDGVFETHVPQHGAVMIKVGRPAPAPRR